MLAEASHGYLVVGEPLKALDLRDVITKQIEADNNTRLHAWIPLDWARAYLMLGDIEQSVNEAREFMLRVQAMKAPHAISRVHTFADELETLGYGDVQEVREFKAEVQEMTLPGGRS